MSRLVVSSRHDESGALRRSWLLLEAGALALQVEAPEERLPLPRGALSAVFARYGKPLGVEAPPSEEPALSLPEPAGATLRSFRFLGFGDVYPSDYLLLEAPGAEPLAAPSPLIAAALQALGRAAQRKQG